MDIGTTFSTVMQPIVDLGPLFLIFVVFTIIGLIVRLGVVKAIRNGLMIAAGFQGVYIIVDFFLAKVGPAATALAERFGGVFTYTDIGWAAYAAFSFSAPIAYIIIVLSLAINLVMIVLNLTNTVNLNIWDTWETTCACLIVLGLTGNVAAALIFGCMLLWVNLMMSDWYAFRGYPEKFYGFKGISFYQGFNVVWGLYGHWISGVLDKIPWTSQAKFTPEYVKERFGAIGEPAVLGGVIGALMAIGAGFDFGQVVLLAIELATALVLLPMMSGIVMQALVPVSEAAANFMQQRTKGRQVFIGVDPAIAVGHPAVLAVTILMVPVMVGLAFIVPGAVNVPLADLPALLFLWVFVAAPNKGDMLRTFISAIFMGILGTFLSILVAPWLAMVAANSGISETTAQATSSFLHLNPDQLMGGIVGNIVPTIGVAGIAAIVAVVVLVTGFFRVRWNRAQGGQVAAAAAAD